MKKVIVVVGVIAALIAVAIGTCNSSTTPSANNEGMVLGTSH